jgi:hypothetical protein
MKTRYFDALIACLGELGVLDREDLVLMHGLPSHERLAYVQARVQTAADRTEQEHALARGHDQDREGEPATKRVGGHTWL